MPGFLPVCMQNFVHSFQSAMPGKVADGKQVHTFRIKGIDLAHDAATGSLHKLDSVGRGVIDYCSEQGIDFQHFSDNAYEQAQLNQAMSVLSPPFSREDIAAAWEEIKLQAGKSLWGKDEIQDNSLLFPGTQPGGTMPQPAIDEPLPSVKAMCLNIAHDCNLVCRYCFAAQGRFGGKPMLMSAETAKKAIDFLIGASGSRRYLDVDFFGGEPLLAFDTVKQAVLYSAEEGPRHGKEFRFTLTTNCTLLNKEIIDFLNDWNISVILSLDGRPEVHDKMRRCRDGSFSHGPAVANAQRLVESRGGRDYYVRGTYTRCNLDFHRDARYLYELGFRRMSLEPAIGADADWSITEDDLPIVRESYSELTAFWEDCYKNNAPMDYYHFELGLDRGVCRERRVTGCGAGYEYLAVTPEGTIYPCHQLVGQGDFNLGTILDSPSDTTPGVSQHGQKHVDILKRQNIARKFYHSRVPNKESCIKCWARYLCGGGCHAGALASTGDMLNPDPLACRIMKIRLEFALYVQYIKSV